MIRWLYVRLLELHPSHFRERFAEEMLWIFDQEGAAGARLLGDAAVARLWASGQATDSEAAIALALGASPDIGPETAPPPEADDEDRSLTGVRGIPVASAPPSSLTQREYEIAELVAGGLSNKAIAAELSISHTTAARHVANIMNKLGFNSRSQIAAWVADRAQGPGRAGDPGEPR